MEKKKHKRQQKKEEKEKELVCGQYIGCKIKFEIFMSRIKYS